MTDSRSRVSRVEVNVDPLTAFTALTDELDQWWVRGPINAYDSGRLLAMRCEPRVGGRILEVYDDDRDDVLELARITAWEPGSHLAWQSSLDDVRIDVRFVPTADGTIVELEATIPEGGQDRGGTSFLRVTPPWFGAWVRRRSDAPRQLHDLARLGLTLHYARPADAARWLATAFGFESPNPLPDGEDPLPDDGYGFPWIEFHVGNCSLIIDQLTGPPTDQSQLTHVPWVFVDDLQAHFIRARDRGATIVQEITGRGFTSYMARDIEGRLWRFAQARPTQPR